MMMVVVIVVMMVMVMIMMVMIVSVVMIAIGAADMVLMPVIEEMRIVFQRPFQVEGALVQHAGEIDAGTPRLVDPGDGLDRPEERRSGIECVSRGGSGGCSYL